MSVIIANYNGEIYLKNLFESLSCQTFKNFEVIFVDNASSDKSLDITTSFVERSPFPIKVIVNQVNLGFCEGNNIGIRKAEGEYIVFLNNDTYVDSMWLEELVKTMTSSDKPVVVASTVINSYTGLVAHGVSYDLYGASFSLKENVYFFYGSGAAMLVRKDVFDCIGGFDETLFMYQDEVDLCWRIRLLGYNLTYAPNAKCYHLKHETGDFIKDNLKMPVWKFYHTCAKNRIRISIKNYSSKRLIRRLPLIFTLISLRALLLSVVNRNPQYTMAALNGFAWNLANLEDTIARRYSIQSYRKVGDDVIEKYMLRFSVEVMAIAKILNTLTDFSYCLARRGIMKAFSGMQAHWLRLAKKLWDFF